MAKLTDAMSRQAEIEEVMRTTNLMRIEAAAVVAARHGEDVSDIRGPGGRPLTAEEREQYGLDESILDIVAAGAVDARDGEDSDCIVGPGGRPLTAEERTRLGLGYSFADYDPDLDEFRPAEDDEEERLNRSSPSREARMATRSRCPGWGDRE